MKSPIHPSAEVSDKASIGKDTRIWHQAQVREGAVVGENCNIGKNVYVDAEVVIGSNVKIQNNACIYRGVTLEDDVFVGPGVVFTNDLYPRARLWSGSRLKKTLVKEGASVGANSTIICGNTIGRHALVGAGSVVTADIPDHALAYGNPASVKGYVCACGLRLEKEGGPVKCGGCGREVRL